MNAIEQVNTANSAWNSKAVSAVSRKKRKSSLFWVVTIISGLVLAALAVVYWPYVELALKVINLIAMFIGMIGMGIVLLMFGGGAALDDAEDEPTPRDDPFGDFSMSLNGWD